MLLRSLTVSLAASLRGVDRKTSASFASHGGAPLHRTGPLCFRSGQPGLLTPAGRCRVFRLLSLHGRRDAHARVRNDDFPMVIVVSGCRLNRHGGIGTACPPYADLADTSSSSK